MSSTNKHIATPNENNVVGHWFDIDDKTNDVDGVISSSIGDREGEVFAGRCYKGDSVGYIQCKGTSSNNLKQLSNHLDAASISFWIKHNNDGNSVIQFVDESPISSINIRLVGGFLRIHYQYRQEPQNLQQAVLGSVDMSQYLGTWIKFTHQVSMRSDNKGFNNQAFINDIEVSAPFVSYKRDADPYALFTANRLMDSIDGSLWDYREYAGKYRVGMLSDFSAKGNETTWFTCEEGDGTIAYDSSGNGNHGEIINATLEDFHATDVDVPYSFLNENGYTNFGVYFNPIRYDNNEFVKIRIFDTNQKTEVFANGRVSYPVAFNLDGSIFTHPVLNKTAGKYDDYYLMLMGNDGNGVTNSFNTVPDIENGEYLIKGRYKGGLSITIVDHTLTEDAWEFIQNNPDTNNDLNGATALAQIDRDEMQNYLFNNSGYETAFMALINDATGGNFVWSDIYNSSAISMFHTLLLGNTTQYGAQVNETYFELSGTDFVNENTYSFGFSNRTAWAVGAPFRKITQFTISFGTGTVVGDSFIKIEDGYLREKPLVPANQSSQNLDALNNPLENRGKVKIPLQLTQSNCFVGDGVAYIETDASNDRLTITDKIGKLTFYYFKEDTSGLSSFNALIQGKGINEMGFRSIFTNASGELLLTVMSFDQASKSNVHHNTGKVVTDNQWHKIDVLQDSREFTSNNQTDFHVWIDDELVLTHSQQDLHSHVASADIGVGAILAWSNNSYVSSGRICGVEVAEIDNLNINARTVNRIIYPLNDGNGSTIYGLDENNQELTGDILNPTLPDNWGKQDVYHYNAWEGVYENVVDIPDEDWTIFTIDTTLTDGVSTDAQSMMMRINQDVIIDWGDGTVEHTNEINPVHRYNTSGVYQIKYCATNPLERTQVLLGRYPTSSFLSLSPTVDRIKTTSINQWGRSEINNGGNGLSHMSNLVIIDAQDLPLINNASQLMYGNRKLETIARFADWDFSNVLNLVLTFFSCRELDFTPLENTDFSHITNFTQTFRSCVNFNIDVSNWNVSSTTNMSSMFMGCTSFEGTGIENWNVGNCTNFNSMFRDATSFNADVSNWDMSSAIDLTNMFYNAAVFNRNLSNWNTSNVTTLSNTFYGASAFNNGEAPGSSTAPLTWNVSNAITLNGTFMLCSSFNQPLRNATNTGPWNTSLVTNMSNTFRSCTVFNQPLNDWNTSNVTQMFGTFALAHAFNQDLNNWDVSNVTNMGWMFRFTSTFNGDISAWNTQNVTDMSFMFSSAIFNGNISSWNVSSVQSMHSMFSANSQFNQDLSSWDVSSVTNMSNMFENADSFNQYIGDWNTVSLININSMFRNNDSFNNGESAGQSTSPLLWNMSNAQTLDGAFNRAHAFNQDVNSWDTSNVQNFNNMFKQSNNFNRPLNNWSFVSATSIAGEFISIAYSNTNYGDLLISIESQNVQDNVTLGAPHNSASGNPAAVAAKAALIADHNWIIQDADTP